MRDHTGGLRPSAVADSQCLPGWTPVITHSVAFQSLRSLQRRLRLLGAAAQSAATPKNGLRAGRVAPSSASPRPWLPFAVLSPALQSLRSLRSLQSFAHVRFAHSSFGGCRVSLGGWLRPPHRPGRWGVLSGMTLASLTMPDVLWAPLPLVGFALLTGPRQDVRCALFALPHARNRCRRFAPRRLRHGSPPAFRPARFACLSCFASVADRMRSSR